VPEALDTLNRMTPHVLVIDIGLPEYNGYALIGRIRAMDDLNKRNVPAIALTAFATTTDRDTALTSGFQMFLTKPFDTDHLIDAVAQVIGFRRDAA
jgi:CheY-like chemotaxis protein